VHARTDARRRKQRSVLDQNRVSVSDEFKVFGMPDFSIYFRGTPWSLPIVGVAAVVLLAAAPAIGARLRLSPPLVWLTLMSIVGYLSVTVTPTGSYRPWGADWNFSWAYQLPMPADLFRVNYDSLNIWLALPMGFFIALCSFRKSLPALLIIPFGVAVGAELVQTAVPPLGRSAFLLSDVTNAWAGVLLGIGIAAVLRSIVQESTTSRSGQRTN
jgi:hypothetical protein